MISNLPSGVTDEMIDGPPVIQGEECFYCSTGARDSYLESEGIRPTWNIKDKIGRPYCSNDCRIEQIIRDGNPREQLKALYVALVALAEVKDGAWFALEEAGADLFDAGEDNEYKFINTREFRNGVQSLLEELCPSDDEPKWLEGAK